MWKKYSQSTYGYSKCFVVLGYTFYLQRSIKPEAYTPEANKIRFQISCFHRVLYTALLKPIPTNVLCNIIYSFRISI